jgi:uncharacterized protein YdcH (DUF465 family)
LEECNLGLDKGNKVKDARIKELEDSRTKVHNRHVRAQKKSVRTIKDLEGEVARLLRETGVGEYNTRGNQTARDKATLEELAKRRISESLQREA